MVWMGVKDRGQRNLVPPSQGNGTWCLALNTRDGKMLRANDEERKREA